MSLTAQNPKSILEMFGSISKNYDLANSVLSFGIHQLWKKALVRKSEVKPGMAVLDCATGTGDLAFLFEKALRGSGSVVGSDFCEPMLEVARKKAEKRRSQVCFEWGDLMKLPYSDHQFDISSASFGIRNVKSPVQALTELGRVTKPGGKVLVLEFGQPESKFMSKLFGFYSTTLLPRMGGWISGQKQAYKYLQTSSATFPCGSEFLKMATSTGYFEKVSYGSFQGGIAYLYVLTKKQVLS
jgi:demethylmenaquinone methyltransferase / 2-methoxy-6-polyprenyl-1,4-benzoquinol methylase